MNETLAIAFDDADVLDFLNEAAEADVDRTEFGVIGFDAEGVVRRYNATESRYAGLSPQRVLDHPLFTVVAPCMNNFMVAQRFEDASAGNSALDVTIDYVLTLRMKPVKVRLRLLARPDQALRYVLVSRRG